MPARIPAFPAAIIALAIVSLAPVDGDEPAAGPEQFYGTWQQDVAAAGGARGRVMKIITPTHFAVFRQVQSERQREFQAHSGPHRIDGATLSETYEFSSDPRLSGTTARSTVRIVDDRLHQTWSIAGGQTITEVWHRAKAGPNARELPPGTASLTP